MFFLDTRRSSFSRRFVKPTFPGLEVSTRILFVSYSMPGRLQVLGRTCVKSDVPLANSGTHEGSVHSSVPARRAGCFGGSCTCLYAEIPQTAQTSVQGPLRSDLIYQFLQKICIKQLFRAALG